MNQNRLAIVSNSTVCKLPKKKSIGVTSHALDGQFWSPNAKWHDREMADAAIELRLWLYDMCRRLVETICPPY